MRNRDRNERPFDNTIAEAVWKKGRDYPGADPRTRKRDMCGATIDRAQYGNEVATGWEIDHIKPRARGGSDDLSNLQPLQWENNLRKGSDYPDWNCLRRG